MNSILQALVHIPPAAKEEDEDEGFCREAACLACDVDGVISAVFPGDRTPYSSVQFLHSWWQHSASLVGYEQQDAHEFFIGILDRIHEKEQHSHSNKGIGDCHCIAHKVFPGILRSDVTCAICGFPSTNYDPCVDISIDLEPSTASTVSSGKSTKTNQSPATATLMGCLDHFTRPDKLGPNQKLYCRNCQARQGSVKQMSV